jgi:hypothetical protein
MYFLYQKEKCLRIAFSFGKSCSKKLYEDCQVTRPRTGKFVHFLNGLSEKTWFKTRVFLSIGKIT